MLWSVSLTTICMCRSPSTCTSKWISCILLSNEGEGVLPVLHTLRRGSSLKAKVTVMGWNLSPPSVIGGWFHTSLMTDHLLVVLISLIVFFESHPSPAVDCVTTGRLRNGDHAAELAHFPSAWLSCGQSSRSWCPSLNTPPLPTAGPHLLSWDQWT